VPGAYLAAILVSAAGVIALDVRFSLVGRPAPWRTVIAVAVGTAVLLATDLLAISHGVFVQGATPLYVGVSLAPHLPLEEPLFLAFLSYLALVVWATAQRAFDRSMDRRRS
jgi:lycopene cyclase domain-containing protein